MTAPFGYASSRGRLAGPSDGTLSSEPTDLCFGMRIGIRSCVEEKYIAAFPRAGASRESLDLEVSGFHPFRQNDATDRTADCPSEWVVLQHSWQQHRGPVHVGDEVCFVKELVASGESRKDRHLLYLALGPAAEGGMEPTIEKLDVCTELCKWTLVHADDPTFSGKVQADTPLAIRGRYKEFIAPGKALWETPGSFRSPARASGKSLVCRAGDRMVGHGGTAGGDNTRPSQHMKFRLVKAGVPCNPDPWPHSQSALVAPPAQARDMQDLASLTTAEQEHAFLEDLLFCLLGVEGTHIRWVSQDLDPITSGTPILPEVRVEVDAPRGADISIVQFVQQIVPLCEHHAAVLKFVEVHGQYEYGTVNHALCAAIRELLREFSIKVGQLETALRLGNLTLAKLWYHVQPSMDTLTLLHRVAASVFNCIGGQVLNGIEEVMSRSSLTTAQDLCEHLLQQASQPYFEMVSKWVYEGCLDDPYGEFFVSENPRARDEKTGGPAADFWQKHFALEEHSVPQFLRESREKILHAGKYLHVFFSASPNAQLPKEENRSFLRYSRRHKDCMNAIDAAYRRASAALLGLFMSPRPEGLDLPGRLKSMRSFFFLSNADWFGQLMDAAVEELESNAVEVPLTRLEGMLDLAIGASSVAKDAYREDMSCAMHSFKIEEACKRMAKGQPLPNEEDQADSTGGHASDSLANAIRALPSRVGANKISGMQPQSGRPTTSEESGKVSEESGVRCFTLKYRTSWPVSIIFSKGLMLKYQVIFRHLLYCRYVERKLVDVWVDHQFTKDLGLDSTFSPSYSLRQRMLHFCRDYIYYATVEVLEPQSHRFLASLEQAETIDEVIKSHEKFLDTCLRELLLTEREGLYKHLSRVLNTCASFATNFHHALHRFAAPRDDQTEFNQVGSNGRERRLKRREEVRTTYSRFAQQQHSTKSLTKFKALFETQLHGFLRQIQQESTRNYEQFLSNMLTRLDYNDYYISVLTDAASDTSFATELDTSQS